MLRKDDDARELAKELERAPEAISKKLERMGVVVGTTKIHRTTTSAIAAEGLFTHEAVLTVVAGAVDLLCACPVHALRGWCLRPQTTAELSFAKLVEEKGVARANCNKPCK